MVVLFARPSKSRVAKRIWNLQHLTDAQHNAFLDLGVSWHGCTAATAGIDERRVTSTLFSEYTSVVS
jgi:hypothetical protein